MSLLSIEKKSQDELEKKFKKEKIKSLIEWEIANEVIIQPILQQAPNAIVAEFAIVKTTNEQLNNLKTFLNNNQ